MAKPTSAVSRLEWRRDPRQVRRLRWQRSLKATGAALARVAPGPLSPRRRGLGCRPSSDTSFPPSASRIQYNVTALPPGESQPRAPLFMHRTGRSFEIIIVDDCSEDETLLAPLAFAGAVRILQTRRISESCNAGAAMAKGRYLFLLNNDTLVKAGWTNSSRRSSRCRTWASRARSFCSVTVGCRRSAASGARASNARR